VSLLNLKTWVHYYVALLKRLGPIKFSLLLAFAVIVFDAGLQVMISYFFSGEVNESDLLRSVSLSLLITPWAVYFLTVVVNDLDTARLRLGSTVDKLEQISKEEKAKTHLLEIEIVEHQKTQQRLREGTSLLRSFLDTSPDLIFHRNTEGRFVSCNKAMEILCGKTEEELIGLLPTDIYSKEYGNEVLKRDKEVIRSRKEMIHEQWLHYPNERVSYVEVRVLPLLNSQKECVGLIGFGRDITDRKKHQESLEKASRDKTTFISTISHELRTPLNGIVGLSRMLLDENFNAEQTQYLKTIHMSAITLGNIFNDIVDLDKLDRRRLNLVRNCINTADFLNDLQSLAYIQTEQKKLTLSFEQVTALPEFVESDDTRLRQVLWNLITNAVKFTEEGKVSICCSSSVEEQQTWLHFEVSDTGIGIPEDKLDKIFAMYYQVKGNRYATGTGIGLSVSNKIVKAMNGRLSVSSELGKGSTFSLSIPTICVSSPTTENIQVPTLSILLVEDIELNVLVARTLIEKQGHHVDVAVNGKEAIEKVKNTEYQLILMDIQLPDINGYEVTKKLRETHDSLPPIVALTANVFSEPRQFTDKGMDDAIGKPLSVSVFNNMLARHFSDFKGAPLIEEAQQEVNETIPEEEELFNEKVLREFSDFLPASIMLDNLKLFEETMPEYLSILDNHMVAKNQEGIVSQSHKIKSAAASVGLLRIQELAQKMQSPDLPAWWDNVEDWYELIQSLYVKDINELKKWIVANF